MKLLSTATLLLSSFAALLPSIRAERILESSSLSSCQDNSGLSASLFNVVITPNNATVTVRIIATVSIQGTVFFDVALNVYGYRFYHLIYDPCDGDLELPGLCPMSPGVIDMPFNFPLGSALDQIPGIAYGIPDLDATVRAYVNMTDTKESVACVEADFSNGKTVDLKGVKWATAVIVGLGLLSSAAVSILGHHNAAAHLAANTLSLFGYFQSQAIVGLTGIHMPPIAQAWTQDFQWSMGIIRVGWMQDIFTWYQRATGGDPATLFSALGTVSVQVAKRSLEYIPEAATNLVDRGVALLSKRANIELESGSYIVYGIQRVAFRAKIETTNLFLTGLVWFCIFIALTIIFILLLKGTCELCVKQKWIEGDRFLEFRSDWLTLLKGTLLRVALIGFPQLAILCLWEFTQVDSPALVVLAVFFFFGTLFALSGAAFTILQIARNSAVGNPAHTLFADPYILNKWGFLYVQFRASGYYFLAPLVFYILIKSMFIALGQHHGVLQAIALILIEVAALITCSVMRPWMDKSTNSFNIAIYVFNFINAIFLFIFTNVLDIPGVVPSAVGVILFVINAAFSLILLLMIIASTALIFWRKNPDARYHFMADDRASFMKSQTQLDTTNELDALAATARGDKSNYGSYADLHGTSPTPTGQYTNAAASRSQLSMDHNSQGRRSPADPSLPLFPANDQVRPSSLRQRVGGPNTGSQTNLSVNSRSQNHPPSNNRSQNNAR
ncbi:hypothetical protein ACJ41O_006039 [Fusarium nematophilum]